MRGSAHRQCLEDLAHSLAFHAVPTTGWHRAVSGEEEWWPLSFLPRVAAAGGIMPGAAHEKC